ncbi:MAG: O-antigen ligase family protein [Patescibacteria group bacterium]
MTSQIILLIAFSLCYAFIAYRRTDWAVAITILLLPTYLIRYSNDFFPFTLLEAMLLLLFLIWLFKAVKNKEKIIWPNWLLAVIFLLSAIVATFLSPDLRSASGLLKAYFIEPALFFFVLVNVIKEKKQLKMIAWALGLLVVWLSIYGVVQMFSGVGIPDPWQAEEGRRIVSVYDYPNALGLIIAPIIALFIALAARVKFFTPRNFWWGFMIVILGIFSLMASVSQGAWLGLGLAMVFLSFFLFNWKKVLATWLVLVILILAIPQTRDYVMPLITFSDVSGDVRKVMWQGTYNLLKARPMVGAGLAGFPHYYEQYRLIKHTEFLLYPHNVVLNFWVELGLFGLIVFVGLIIQFFRQARRLLKTKNVELNWAIALMTAMVCLLGHGLVDVPYFKNDLAILFWLLLGMMAVVYQWNQKSLTK